MVQLASRRVLFPKKVLIHLSLKSDFKIRYRFVIENDSKR
jgi:hypothetical protein